MAGRKKAKKKAAKKTAGSRSKRATRKKTSPKKAAPAKDFVILFDDDPPAADDNVVTLAADCTLEQAPGIKANLVAALEQGSKVRLDASAVQEVDTAALQLLCAFARTAMANGLNVEWQAPSPAFRDAAGRLGIADYVGSG